jgi:septum formation protein
MNLILASTSPYRRRLLERLRLPFTCMDPAIEESMREGESPSERASRLATEKASAAAKTLQGNAIVIGSDQVACLGTQILHKPVTAEAAERQLTASSGQTVHFWTAVSVWASPEQAPRQRVVPCEVKMRALSAPEITRYVALDQPLDCAGSFKWESLGITLFEAIRTDDPTALEGLPLIALGELLREAGISLPLAAQSAQHGL